MQEAFIRHDAFQCGYCTPGQIMSAVALLAEGRAGSRRGDQEFMSGNLCRCGAYPNILAAIREVARRARRRRDAALRRTSAPLDTAEAVRDRQRRPGRGVPGRRHDAARPDAQGRRRRAPSGWSTSPGSRCAAIDRATARAPRRRAHDDGGARRGPDGRRAAPARPRGAAARRLRRSCATWRRSAATCCSARAAGTSATRGRRLQQARARLGLRRGHGSGPDARDPRRERALHRAACLRPLRRAGRARRDGAHPGPGRRRAASRSPSSTCSRASGRTSRPCSTHGELITGVDIPCRRRARARGT